MSPSDHLIAAYNRVPHPRPQLGEWLNSPNAFEAFLAGELRQRNSRDRRRIMAEFLAAVDAIMQTEQQEQGQTNA